MSNPTSYVNFVATIAGLSITGVRRSFDHPPQRLAMADLPASFPRIPSGDERAFHMAARGTWPTLRCQLIVVINPYMADRNDDNFDAILSMMDNVSTALRNNGLASGPSSWSIRHDILDLGQSAYHVVICDIEAFG